MKKKNVMIITAAVLVCAITITGIARAVRGGGSAVDVTQVSYLNSGWWDEGTSTSGYVTANAHTDMASVRASTQTIANKLFNFRFILFTSLIPCHVFSPGGLLSL